METTIPTPTESGAANPSPVANRPGTRRLQDRSAAERITRALEILRALENDPELNARLQPRGFTAERVAAGLALQANAQAAYNARQQAIAAQAGASEALALADDEARREYRLWRSIARTLFTTPAARAALELDGRIPNDLEAFISSARAAYAAALANPDYQIPLGENGYPAARLQELQTALDTLITLERAHETQRIAALRATQAREDALHALDVWLRRLRLAARVAARDRPDLARRVIV